VKRREAIPETDGQ